MKKKRKKSLKIVQTYSLSEAFDKPFANYFTIHRKFFISSAFQLTSFCLFNNPRPSRGSHNNPPLQKLKLPLSDIVKIISQMSF